MDELETQWNKCVQIVEEFAHTLEERKSFFDHMYTLKVI